MANLNCGQRVVTWLAGAPLLGSPTAPPPHHSLSPKSQSQAITRPSKLTMPLIIISGYPCSGKTTRALQLQSYFNEKISAATATATADADAARISKLKVHLVNSESLHIPRTVYREARTEKEARANEYSAVKRLLGKDDIVIADGLNYIKGYRYQLFCEAKALLTPSCVVHVASPPDTCRLWNSTRPSSDIYPPDIFDNLLFRYEEPNGMSRWDSPLFTVPYIDETPDLPGIWDALVGSGVKVKANQATVLRPAVESDYLYELDKTTQDVVTLVLEHQKSAGAGGGRLPVPECETVLELPAQSITVPQLQRIRRQFISLNRQYSVGRSRIRELFVEYVNGEFR